MEWLYEDNRILVCVKPFGVRSTDEPGGLPSLIRQQLGDPQACVRTVHRLDQVVGGLMVVARSRKAASLLSQQMAGRNFYKEYLAVVHGTPPADSGTFTDLLLRNKGERKTYVVDTPQKDAQEAILDYQRIASRQGLSLVRIHLHTGRTHQIRVQFSSRGLPLVGDQKYGLGQEDCNIALWSHCLQFRHPESDQLLRFTKEPPALYPWTEFSTFLTE
jgi:23S rRNA pseudouridine1911/1915/1917 synthase